MSSAGEGAPRAARKFVLDNVLVALAQLLGKLRGLVTLPLLVRGLGAEGYGIWVQVISLAGIVGNLLSLNLHTPLVRMAAADRVRAKAIVSTLTVAALGALTLGCAVLALASPAPLARLVAGTGDRRLFIAAMLVTWTTAARQFPLSTYRATERVATRSTADFLGTLVDVALTVALLTAGFGLVEVFWASAAWGALFVALTLAHQREHLALAAFDGEILREATRYSLPLLPATLGLWALDRADRFVLQHFRGEAEVGVYSAHYTLASLATFMLFSLQLTLLPRCASLWAADREGARRYLDLSCRAFTTFGLLFATVAPFAVPAALRVLAPATATPAAPLNSALVATGVLFYGFGIIQQMVLFITQRTRAVGLILAGSAAMNLGLNVALAPRLGGTGAALATLITYALMAGATFFASRDVLLVRLGLGHATRCLAAGLAAGTTFALLDPRTIAGIVLASLASLTVYALALLATGAVRPAEVRNAMAVVRGRSDARTSPPSR